MTRIVQNLEENVGRACDCIDFDAPVIAAVQGRGLGKADVAFQDFNLRRHLHLVGLVEHRDSSEGEKPQDEEDRDDLDHREAVVVAPRQSRHFESKGLHSFSRSSR